ncbi:MAG: 3-keto-5-aminohexanoate cleavage protein [Lachnospiraceae bacterium]|nr:3-keto-5-aminohexanoate cleavage protein [Lachnospiraceae bacterium]
MSDKVIITAALTGTSTPVSLNPNLPATPERIAEDAYNCWKAGAAIVHLHMRDANGKGVFDVEMFRKTIELIRAHEDCDVVINCTSSGQRGGVDEMGSTIPVEGPKRMEHFQQLDGIEIGSMDCGTFNWMPNYIFINSPNFLRELGKVYNERGIKPEIEVFDVSMMNCAKALIKEGIIKTPAHFQFCLGAPGGMEATVDNLQFLLKNLPEGSTWSAFGTSKNHLPILFAALALDGHIRVGLEDNVYYSKGVLATNQMLVERAVKAVELFGKKVATPSEAREMLGIPQLNR